MQVVDLFSGAGLFSHGLSQAGLKPVLAIDSDPVALSTYQQNHDCDVILGDIQSLPPQKIKADIIVAGPPCQGFSTLGKRLPTDCRNRLSLKVASWVKVCDPTVVVIENVPQFLTSQQYRYLKSAFVALGYDVQSWLLDAYDYGVPQHRRRAFLVASKVRLVFPRKSTLRRTVRDAFKGIRKTPTDPMLFAPKPTQIASERIRVVPKGGDKRDIMKAAPELAPPSWWTIPNQATDVWGRMHWDRPSNTLRTCFQSASKGRYLHPEKNRVITLREGARLHSIPDSYTFHGTPTQITRQIGNGVPPLLGRAIGRAILRVL